MVIKAAGVPLNSPEIAAARAAGVPVYMSTALFAKYAREAGARIVGVTGTRGKTTVARLIYHTLQKAGRSAYLGGNIRGISTLAMLPHIKKGDMVVLELDSWQLQGFGDLKISPQIAVFTNLMPDHQNYYPDMETYLADKSNIFKYQKDGEFLFVDKSLQYQLQTGIVPLPIPDDWTLRIIGEHNRENAAFAAAALGEYGLGLSEDEIRAGLESFEGVEGRLQNLREINGIKIYNDNNSTTPEATIAALRAVGKEVTLIIGGSEKGLALETLVGEIREHTSSVIVLVHQNYAGSERLMRELEKVGIVFEKAEDLKVALSMALKNAKGTVLFSPAFASFGMFKNEYDRNDTFVTLVQNL
jgi:UDP-N-acetylmuramoylalanine--D-glutamate ligase